VVSLSTKLKKGRKSKFQQKKKSRVPPKLPERTRVTQSFETKAHKNRWGDGGIKHAKSNQRFCQDHARDGRLNEKHKIGDHGVRGERHPRNQQKFGGTYATK